MRLFTPVYISAIEMHMVRLGLRQGCSPVRLTAAYYGPITFVPVRVYSINDHKIDIEFLRNRAPLLDIPAVDGCKFLYVYGDNDTGDVCEKFIKVSCLYDGNLIKDVELPSTVEPGDILLSSREHPLRGAKLAAALRQQLR